MDSLYQDSSVSAAISLTGEKACRECKASKHVTEFVIARGGRYKDGRKNICKPCQRAKNAEFTKKNPNYWAERGRKTVGVSNTKDCSWRGLDAALGMCRKITPLQRGV